jgi:uncharacterized integral membrane protein
MLKSLGFSKQCHQAGRRYLRLELSLTKTLKWAMTALCAVSTALWVSSIFHYHAYGDNATFHIAIHHGEIMTRHVLDSKARPGIFGPMGRIDSPSPPVFRLPQTVYQGKYVVDTTVPLWLVILGAAVASMVLWRVDWVVARLRYRHEHTLCFQCGYDLRMNVSGRCPECASDIPAEPELPLRNLGGRVLTWFARGAILRLLGPILLIVVRLSLVADPGGVMDRSVNVLAPVLIPAAFLAPLRSAFWVYPANAVLYGSLFAVSALIVIVFAHTQANRRSPPVS